MFVNKILNSKIMKKLTNDEVIEKLKSLYGETLDYSKVQYINSRNPITLICPIHGKFEQYANNALQGKGGCPKCKLGISNQSEFIKAAKERFGDKFTYGKTKFKNLSTKVVITCPIHGDFEVTPRQFLQAKYGCRQCYNDSKKVEKPRKLTIQEKLDIRKQKWIDCCTNIHNNKYDYSKVDYRKACEKVCIICPEHGEFWQTPTDHKSGRGCPRCGRVTTFSKVVKSQEIFEKSAREVHGYKYTYGKYKGMHSYMEISCPKHGMFLCTPHNHLYNRTGCPKCNQSYGEQLISEWLDSNNIQYIYQFNIKQNTTNRYMDFYFTLNNINYAIEYNGIQHYKPVEFFGGEKAFIEQQERDQFIRSYCNEQNIQLIEISYLLSREEVFKYLTNLIKNESKT